MIPKHICVIHGCDEVEIHRPTQTGEGPQDIYICPECEAEEKASLEIEE